MCKLLPLELEGGLLFHRIVTVSLQNTDQKNLVFNVPLELLYLVHQVFEFAPQIQIHNEGSFKNSAEKESTMGASRLSKASRQFVEWIGGL
ncbi:hypothetical protein ACVWYH_000007 [Bradyrhizobium sp. GM24.11]